MLILFSDWFILRLYLRQRILQIGQSKAGIHNRFLNIRIDYEYRPLIGQFVKFFLLIGQSNVSTHCSVKQPKYLSSIAKFKLYVFETSASLSRRFTNDISLSKMNLACKLRNELSLITTIRVS